MERSSENGLHSMNSNSLLASSDDLNNNTRGLVRTNAMDAMLPGITDLNRNPLVRFQDIAENDNTSHQNNINKEDSTGAPTSNRRLRDRKQRRIIPEKVRQKRQTLQDMARPLKHWLCRHRNNPYPTKSEKTCLARESSMNIIQISNWFANARRRLKNTVNDPNLSWQSRIRQYNSNVKGNAELLSISSDDSIWNSEDEAENDMIEQPFHSNSLSPISDNLPDDPDRELVPSRSQTPTGPGDHVTFLNNNVSRDLSVEDIGSRMKYKQTILQRYLTDSYRNVDASQPVSFDDESFTKPRMRRQSGSLGSRDYEELSTSSGASVNEYHHGVFDDNTRGPVTDNARGPGTDVKRRRVSERTRRDDEMYWKEISAAMALTSLAKKSMNF
ncbi:hypothetical protein ScPMuIL_016863 [Solemya velum]